MAEGICHDLNRRETNAAGKAVKEVKVSLDYISTHDGSSTTLLLAEKATTWDSSLQQDKPWTSGNWYKRDSVDRDGQSGSHISSGHVSFGWLDDPDDVTSGHDPRRTVDSISSRHGGIVIVSFCDGHQYSLRDDIEYSVLSHLAAPYDKGAVDRKKYPNHPLLNETLDESVY
jgi:prepilin-type processing-associated H-X9-DG protein